MQQWTEIRRLVLTKQNRQRQPHGELGRNPDDPAARHLVGQPAQQGQPPGGFPQRTAFGQGRSHRSLAEADHDPLVETRNRHAVGREISEWTACFAADQLVSV